MKIIVFNSGVKQPEDKKIFLKDIIETGQTDRDKSYCVDANYAKGGNVDSYLLHGRRQLIITGGAFRGRNPENPTSREPGLDTVQMLEMRGDESTNRVYSPDGKSPYLTAIQGGGQEPKVSTDSITWRKLTVKECERLQTVNTTYEIRMDICLDQARLFVSAVEKNHKLLSLVGNVEKIKFQESVKNAGKNILQREAQTELIVAKNADTLIPKEIHQCTKNNQNEVYISVNNAEKLTMFNYQEIAAGSVIQNVFMNIISESITNLGKADCHLIDKNVCQRANGRRLYQLSGNEIMQLVEYADTITTTDKKEKCTFTILDRLSISNIAQTLIILYWYVKSVITLYTQEKIQNENILLTYETESSYCHAVSNSRAYHALGNGWTVDVIAHILRAIK